jgi:tRNA U55 pseudouridine synthase TruB
VELKARAGWVIHIGPARRRVDVDHVTIEIECGKGTYVAPWCATSPRASGSAAAMSSDLRRTRVRRVHTNNHQ